MKEYIVEKYTTAEEIKRVRTILKLTQREFAALIGCSKPTVERWESSDAKITGPIVLLLRFLENHADEVSKLSVPEKKYPIRMWYMYKNKKCTLIDVDEVRQLLKIQNYTDNLMFRAFGGKEEPNFQDYKAFLESRCFAESRDKMKLILEDLDLPFYDPYLIVRKTEGRMAEDDFWIDIEEG